MNEAFAVQELRVGTVEDVPLNEGRTVSVAGRPLAVFRTETGWYAIDNTCTHMGGPLADGIVADDSVACPLHDRRFSLTTGEPLNHECGAVAVYPVAVRDDEVFLAVPVMRPAGEGEKPSQAASNGAQSPSEHDSAAGAEGTKGEGRSGAGARAESPPETDDPSGPLDPAHPSPSES
jgi:nitrite reductase (NADH) small subunit